jgi:hypothetical protein
MKAEQSQNHLEQEKPDHVVQFAHVPDSETTVNGKRRAGVGIVEWFWPGRHEHVEQTLADMRALGVNMLRTGFSWADWCTDEGKEWYEWLLPLLAKEVEVLPCFVYTPPSFGIVPKTSSPPRDPEIYGGFIDEMITRFGHCFEWVQLWNEPNNSSGWDFSLDRGWLAFSQMVGGAANWAKIRGKKTVLGGMSPIDPNWLRLESFRAMIPYFDVIAIHGFPGTFDFLWDGWDANVQRIREVLDEAAREKFLERPSHRSRAVPAKPELGFPVEEHYLELGIDRRNRVAAGVQDLDGASVRGTGGL